MVLYQLQSEHMRFCISLQFITVKPIRSFQALFNVILKSKAKLKPKSPEPQRNQHEPQVSWLIALLVIFRQVGLILKSVNIKIELPFIMEMQVSLLKSDWRIDLQAICDCRDCFSFFWPSPRYFHCCI